MTTGDERMPHEGMDLPPMPGPDQQQHVWVGHGLAAVPELTRSEEEAIEGVETWVGTAPLEISGVICAACDQTVEGAEWACPGPSGDTSGHHWKLFTTLRMSEVEVFRWASMDEAWSPEKTPRIMATICILCGQQEGSAEEECPRRRYWAIFGALPEEDA